VLVTGATSGIGMCGAQQLAALGAHVVVAARNGAKADAVVADIVAAGGRASALTIDLASFASIRRAADVLGGEHARLDVLVNNAGIAPGKRESSVDGYELTWTTNFLGLVLLTRSLLPLLARASEPRVVNVSSDAHRYGSIDWDDLNFERRRFRGIAAYAQSKLAVNLHTRELARREPGIAVNAVHPGAIATNIWRAAPPVIRAILDRVLPAPGRGAVPVVRLATSEDVRGTSGRYFNKLAETEPSPRSRNDADAARLWDVAERAIAT